MDALPIRRLFHLTFLSGAAALLAAATPAHADPLAATVAPATTPRAVVFCAVDEGTLAPQAPEPARVDPLLPLALVLAIPAGTSADPGASDSSNSVVKSPNSQGNSNDPNLSFTANVIVTTNSVSPSPEPASLLSALLGSGLAGFAALRRRRLQHQSC